MELPAYMQEVRPDQSVKTDGEGRFEFRELPKGKYKITVEPGSSDFDPKAQAYGTYIDPDAVYDYPSNANVSRAVNTGAYTTSSVRLGTSKPSKPEFAKVSKEFVVEDDDLKDQVVELTTGATLIGTVVPDSASDGIDAVTITAKNDETQLERSQNLNFYDYSGEVSAMRRAKQKDFRLSGITPGNTSFTIKVDGNSYVKSAVSNQVDLLAGPVDLKSGETLANIRIVLASDTGTVKGKLIDENKEPLVGRTITFVPTDKVKSKNATYYREVRTDANGEFEIKLPPFEYAVVFPPKNGKPLTDKWLDSALSGAQTVQIEIARTSTITIKRNSKDEKPVSSSPGTGG